MKSFRSCFASLWRDVGRVRVCVAVSCILGAGIVALGLGFVWISKRVVDIATSNIDASLTESVVWMAVIMCLQILLRVAHNYWEGVVVIRTSNAIRAEAFGKVMRGVWNGKDRFHSADAVNRLEEDIRVIVDFLCSSFPGMIVTFVQLVAASVFLFNLAPSLAWILVLIMPVAVLGSKLFFREIRKVTGEIRAQESTIQGHIQENIQHRVVVNTLGATAGVLDKMGSLQEILKSKTFKRLNYSAVSGAFLRFGFAAGYATAFFWGVFGIKGGTVSYGLMVAFLQLVGQIQRPVADIASYIPAFIKALASEERLEDLLTIPQEKTNDDILISEVPGVRIENLSFSYGPELAPVFSNLTFDFKPGTTTAIIGQTGIGKSTLSKLIISLLKPVSGKVVLYTTSGKEYELSSALGSNFQYVPQGNTLFSGTIRQNLLLAKPGADEDELREALHLAAADFVYELPDALETSCAEVGAGLSEGQAQRIAVARALLRPGGILVLDEATSSLDSDTELQLLSRISDRFKGKKTIICITHRQAATSFADSVLKLGE